jgi:hypothetical protein
MRAAWLVCGMAMTGCDKLFGLEDVTAPAVDARPPDPYITCSGFQPVLASEPSPALVEPGLHPDGLRMVVRQDGVATLRELRRDDTMSSFVTASLSAFPAGVGDPSFVTIGDTVYGFGAQTPSPRRIVICPDPASTTTCSPITMLAETGEAITTDIDGPSVALRDGRLVMAFNHQIAAYVAEPETDDLLVWRARWVQEAGVMIDDPALTRDGRLLIVPNDRGLEALRWDDTVQNYVQPTPVSEIGASPEIGVQSESQTELFVTWKRDGSPIAEPFVATCARR